MLTLLKTQYGNGIAVGIEGEQQEAELYYNQMYNYGATNGELIQKGSNFWYFISDETRLAKAIFGIASRDTRQVMSVRPMSFREVRSFLAMRLHRLFNQFNENERFVS